MDAIYARQSVDKKDSVSIETQIDYCRRYTAAEALVYQDKGFSGKNTNRPDFHRLMDAVEAGQVKKIVVYRLDRFSRSIADFGQIWDKLERHGVEFTSVTENFDTSSPMGRAMLNIVLVFAQLERETIAERVRDNYEHRFSLGAWPGGPAPFGFSLCKIADEQGRMASSLVPNEKADVVTQLFHRYLQDDISLRALAQSLNAERIPGPKRATWDNISISRILHSPLYVQATEDVYWWYMSKGMQCKLPAAAFDGRHACNIIGRRDRSKNKYNDLAQQQFTLANHQGFIPAELWLACQMKLEKNGQVAIGPSGKHSWLTGLLKCAHCGYAIKINHDSKSGKFYLLCSNRTNTSACRCSIRVDLRELEACVAQQLRQFLSECPAEEVYPESDETSKALQQVEERIERLVNALAESSTVAIGYISAQIDKLHAQRRQLLDALTADRRKQVAYSRVDFDAAAMEEKRLIAREFIDRILLQDEQAEIRWKL